MFEYYAQSPETVGMLASFSLIAITILALAGMRTWRKHQAARMGNELKMEMVARGMSVDEIERVLLAKSSSAAKPGDAAYACKR